MALGGAAARVCGAAAQVARGSRAGRCSGARWPKRRLARRSGVGQRWRGAAPARGACGTGAGSCRCLQKLHSPRANEGEQHPVFDSVRPKSFTYSVSL
jgi:hypothetical protein